MKDLQNLVNECRYDIESLGFELGDIRSITVNTRAKRRWGQCRYFADTNTYTINISSRLLADEVDDMSAKNTIAHELLHTIKGGSGHTGAWKRAADRMNLRYGYNIKRCTSSEEKGVKSAPTYRQTHDPKYFIKCSKCGKIYSYWKKSKIVTLFTDKPDYAKQSCRCGRCKSRNTLSLIG